MHLNNEWPLRDPPSVFGLHEELAVGDLLQCFDHRRSGEHRLDKMINTHTVMSTHTPHTHSDVSTHT